MIYTTQIYKLIYCLILTIYSLIRIYFVFKRDKSLKQVRAKKQKFERLNIFIAWLGMMFVPLVYVFTPYLDYFNFKISFIFINIAIVALSLNVYFFYLIHRELSDNWSPILEIKRNQKLVKTGVYKYIRHPMYIQS